MSGATFLWRGEPVPFGPGETIASALAHAGVRSFGRDGAGRALHYFCGIGACQTCLVRVGDRITEACLTPSASGLDVRALED